MDKDICLANTIWAQLVSNVSIAMRCFIENIQYRQPWSRKAVESQDKICLSFIALKKILACIKRIRSWLSTTNVSYIKRSLHSLQQQNLYIYPTNGKICSPRKIDEKQSNSYNAWMFRANLITMYQIIFSVFTISAIWSRFYGHL